MSSLSNREKILIYLLCITVMGYLYFNYLLLPQIKKLQETNALYESNSEKLSTLYILEKSLNQKQKELSELDAKSKEISKSIPDTSKVPEIIMDIKNLTESSGCVGGKMSFNLPSEREVSTEKQDNGSGVESVLKLSVNYEIQGNNDNIMTFLKSIESSTRKMGVERIQINNTKDNKLSANLNINCYYISGSNTPETIDYPFVDEGYHRTNLFN